MQHPRLGRTGLTAAIGVDGIRVTLAQRSPTAAEAACRFEGAGRQGARGGESGFPAALDATFGPEIDEGAYGVLCGESPNPTDLESYNTQAAETNATQSPLGGFASPWTRLAEPCAQWQARDADVYRGPWNRSRAPLLLVGTLADSNTAYGSTLKAAADLGKARVLTETGGGHTALIKQSRCINQYTAAYLIDGTLPPKGTVCNQDQPPF